MKEYTPLEATTLAVYLQVCTNSGCDKHFTVDEVSKAFNSQPFSAFEKGKAGGLLGLLNNYSFWCGFKLEWDVTREDIPNASQLIDEIISLLKGKEDYILSLQREYGAEVSIIIAPIIVAGKSPCLEFSAKQLEFLSRLGISISFDTLICPFEYKKS